MMDKIDNIHDYYQTLIAYYQDMGVDGVFAEDLVDFTQSISTSSSATLSPKESSLVRAERTDATKDDNDALLQQCQTIADCASLLRQQTLPDDMAQKNFLYYAGNLDSDIMLLFDCPDSQDGQENGFLIGEKGVLLNNMLQAIDLSLDDVFYAHIIPWPQLKPMVNNDLFPLYLPFIKKIIALKKPKIIMVFSQQAAHKILSLESTPSALLHQLYPYQDSQLLPTYHLSVLLKNPRQKRYAWRDLLLLKSVITGNNHDKT